MSNGITVDNLMSTFPSVLRDDPEIEAIAIALSELFVQRRAEINKVEIYAKIDSLPEDLLDILAFDFKIDWWDGNCSLSQKRSILKSSWFVHKRLGTKAAVEEAVSAILPDATVSEWFEYSGSPYHFKVQIPLLPDTPDIYDKATQIIEIYKNVRSVLDAIEFISDGGAAEPHALSACAIYTCSDGAKII